jgi:hypothetical protein
MPKLEEEKILIHILPPLQNISKRWSTKVNVFGLKFEPNTSTFFDSFLLIFYNGGSKLQLGSHN